MRDGRGRQRAPGPPLPPGRGRPARWSAAACLLLLGPAAGAARPDRLAATFPEGTGLDDLVVAPDALLAAWVEGGSDELRILDMETWEVAAFAPCAGVDGAAIDTLSDPVRVWAGCADGSVVPVEVAADRSMSLRGDLALQVGAAAILALDADAAWIWVVEDGPVLHHVDPVLLDVDPMGWTATPSRSGFTDIDHTDTYVILAQGQDDVAKVTASSGAVAFNDRGRSGAELVDVEVDGTLILLADAGTGAVLSFQTGSNDYQVLLDAGDGLAGAESLALAPEAADPYLAVSEGDGIALFSYDPAAATVSDAREATLEGGTQVRLGTAGDLLLGAGADGVVSVWSAAPWVTFDPPPGGPLLAGEAAELAFTADRGERYELRLGAMDGPLLAEGDLVPGVPVEVAPVVDGTWIEGANRIFALVEEGGETGWDAVDVEVDNPPSRVDFRPGDVGFADGRLLLSIRGVADEDLVEVAAWFDVAPWSGDDHPTGGPAYEDPAGAASPQRFAAAPGEDIVVELGPLTNLTTYYVGVRAVDAAGQEGPMSDVQPGMPEPTVGAAGLAGESGGWGCATGGPGGAAGGLLAWASAVVVLASRRRRGSVPGLLVGALLVAHPAVARAEDPRTFEGGLRLGPQEVADPSIQAVYGDAGLWRLDLEGGAALWRVVALDAGLGLVRKQGTQVGTATLSPSSEAARLTLAPVSLSLELRLAIFEEQPVVPGVHAGLVGWLWLEQLDDGFGYLQGERVGGFKPGWNWGADLAVLLDAFDRGLAETAWARWGIRNTWLVFDYRREALLPGVAINEQGLDFAGDVFTVGIRMDR